MIFSTPIHFSFLPFTSLDLQNQAGVPEFYGKQDLPIFRNEQVKAWRVPAWLKRNAWLRTEKDKATRTSVPSST